MQRKESTIYWVKQYLTLDESLKHDLIENGKALIISPSAMYADSLRELFHPINDKNEINSITFADFIRKLSLEFENQGLMLGKLSRKSQIYLQLGLFWTQHLKDFEFPLFERAFKTYTDLRSYGLTADTISDLIKKFDHPFDKILEILHRSFLANEYYDEHSLIADLSSYLKSNEIDFLQDNKIYFWGFTNFSGLQLDFINSLNIRYPTSVILPEVIKDNLHTNDWPCWLDHNLLESAKEVKTAQGEARKFQAKAVPSLLMTSTINKLTEIIKPIHIVNFDLNKSPELLNSLPGKHITYKVPERIFDDLLQDLSHEFKALIRQNKLSSLGQLREYISEKITTVLKENKNFRILTPLQEYLKIIDSIADGEFNEFSNKLLFEIMKLNMPRINLVRAGEDAIEFLGIENLFKVKAHEKTILTLFANESWLSPANSKYPPIVLSELREYGPVPSKYFQIWLKAAQLWELLERKGNMLVFEESIWDDKQLSSILFDKLELAEVEQVQLDEAPEKEVILGDKKIDALSPNIRHKKMSATRLQTYLDCNFKYYLRYIKRISSRSERLLSLSESEKGIIAHALISTSCTKVVGFSVERARKFYDEIYQNELLKLGKKGEVLCDQLLKREIYELADNGILLLKSLTEQLTGIKFVFEYEICRDYAEGSIDLYIKSDQGEIVYDFKKSSFSIPSVTEILEFEKIQLPFYLKNLDYKKLLSFGYINLKQPDKSLLFSEENFGHAIDSIKFAKLKVSFSELIKNYDEFESNALSMLHSDSEFKKNPKKKENCDYCDYRFVCPRGE